MRRKDSIHGGVDAIIKLRISTVRRMGFIWKWLDGLAKIMLYYYADVTSSAHFSVGCWLRDFVMLLGKWLAAKSQAVSDGIVWIFQKDDGAEPCHHTLLIQ